MATRNSGVRRWAAVTVTTVLLLTGAACSTEPEPEPEPASSVAVTPAASGTPAPGPTSTPTVSVPPPASTPVPQRSPGDVNSTVPTAPAQSRKPVDLDESSKAGNGVTARLRSVKAVTAEAKGPGEVSGPGLAVTVVVQNGSEEPLALEQVVVTLEGEDGSPGNPMSDRPAKPFTGRLAAGKSATGVYVFALAKDIREPVVIQVTLSGASPILVFEGDAAR